MKRIAGNDKLCLKIKTESCAYGNGVMSQRKALTSQTMDIAAIGGLPHQTACPLSNRFWFDVFSGS
jgi:hypothetical protein